MFEFDSIGRLAGRHKCPGPPQEHRQAKKKLSFDLDASFDLSSISKRFVENMFRDSCKCPVCAKEFSTDRAYYQHLRQKKEVDDAHEKFYNDNKAVISTIDDGTGGTREGDRKAIRDQPAQPARGEREDEQDGEQDGEQEGDLDVPSKETRGEDAGSSTMNAFGRIRLKTKDGKVKSVHTSADWWDEFKKDEEPLS